MRCSFIRNNQTTFLHNEMGNSRFFPYSEIRKVLLGTVGMFLWTRSSPGGRLAWSKPQSKTLSPGISISWSQKHAILKLQNIFWSRSSKEFGRRAAGDLTLLTCLVSIVSLSPSALGKYQKQDLNSLIPLILHKSGSWYVFSLHSKYLCK